jgi:serine/threonine-protein phosphatase 2A regulatory subunit B'
LAELEELLAHIGQPEFNQICLPLTKQLAKCAASHHCRVAEKALQLWNNENVLAQMEPNYCALMPTMFPALYLASDRHWNEQICTMVSQLWWHILFWMWVQLVGNQNSLSQCHT